MTDDQHDELQHHDELPLSVAQRDMAATYHAPPMAIPRDAMWAAIQARRRTAADPTHASSPEAAVVPPAISVTHMTRGDILRRLRMPRWIAAAATAALVVIGISVWRRAPVTTAPTTVAVNTDSASASSAWQVASAEHFGRAETMLTTLSASPQSSGDRELTAWSRDLLESTRLLIDSPAGRDPKRRALLLELELVLVQLVESGPAMRSEDRTVMDEMLSRSALLLTRIRTTVPAGTSASRN